jgi:hypothetical protein
VEAELLDQPADLSSAQPITATTVDCVAISVRSVSHYLHVHFPPFLSGVINRNPRTDGGREQEQRDSPLGPALRSGGTAPIAWIWLDHSVFGRFYPVAVPNLRF